MALTHVYIEPLLIAQESGEIVELPASKSGVQKYIDKSMWEKSRTLAKSVKNRQSMEKELDNIDEEQQQEMQHFFRNDKLPHLCLTHANWLGLLWLRPESC